MKYFASSETLFLQRVRNCIYLLCIVFTVSVVLWIQIDAYMLERGITHSSRALAVTSYSGKIHGTVYSLNRYASCACEIVQIATSHGIDMSYYQLPTIYAVPLVIGTPVTFAYISHGSLLAQVTRVYLS